jgi:hypothetical protein
MIATLPKGQYHVGLLAVGDTAVFEFRRCIDFLNCEILKYLGVRETTKRAARERLKATKATALAELQREYPARGFKYIRID